ncbi:MAG: tetratricopeptide repeat protein, partial [Delftia sp.]|nr:tetratricopeptide repeat protein [Delftia sp.]
SDLRDVSARQRSMRAVFDHSWRLLNEREQEVFQALSVFRGGFTREAAEKVTGATLRELRALVDKSFLHRAGGRYEMHALLQDYGAEKLAQTPAASQATRDRHSAFYLAFVAERETALHTDVPRQVMDEMRSELDNVRRAWRWAVAQARIDALGRSLKALARFYLLSGLLLQGQVALETAADRVQAILEGAAAPKRDARKLLSRLLTERVPLLMSLPQHDQAIATAQAAIRLAQAAQAPNLEAAGYSQWGYALWNKGDSNAARPKLERALALLALSPAPSRAVQADSLRVLGTVIMDQGDIAGGRAYWEQALHIYREIGDRRGQSQVLNNLGVLARDFPADYARARTYLEQALHIRREIGDRQGVAFILTNLGTICARQGDYAGARTHYEQVLHIHRESGARWAESGTLHSLSGLSLEQGEYDRATAYSQGVLRIHREVDDRFIADYGL